uniref:CCHC-type domain-containing protein n=1 Tax=Caenorhabditis japonica TaxID=281687 RepID=A0A8R1IMQ1_CAEJA
EKFEEEKAPKVTGKGIQKSLDFNTNLKNLLRKAVHDGEFMEPVKEVLALLSNRNAELVLLDHDPGILAAKEKIDALKALTSESTGSTSAPDMTSLLLFSQLSGNQRSQTDSRKRRIDTKDSQWFRGTDSFRGNGRVRDHQSQREGRADVKCMRCHRFGHYANRCPQKRSAASDALNIAWNDKIARRASRSAAGSFDDMAMSVIFFTSAIVTSTFGFLKSISVLLVHFKRSEIRLEAIPDMPSFVTRYAAAIFPRALLPMVRAFSPRYKRRDDSFCGRFLLMVH